jgi:hypothetical protein
LMKTKMKFRRDMKKRKTKRKTKKGKTYEHETGHEGMAT